MNDRNYIVNTDENARKRLTLQHKLYEASSLQLLKKAKITPGMHGLEVGCGAGDMTVHIARLVGEEGFLTSIDINGDQIEAAQLQCSEQADRIKFINHNVSNLSDLDTCYDFIYCRMVLHHLLDATHAFNEMVSCIKPGGTLIIEEPVIHDDSFCYPENNAVTTFIKWCRQCFIINNRDFNVAKRLHEIAPSHCSLKFIDINHPLLRTQHEKTMYAMALVDLSPQIRQHNIATQDEIDEAHHKLVNFSYQNHLVTWVRMHQVIISVQ